MCNFYLIVEGGKLALVDAGAPGDWSLLLRTMSLLGREVDDLEAVLLTHAHSDHTGFAERARATAGAHVWIHKADGEVAKGAKQPKNDGRVTSYLLRPEFYRTTFSLLRRGAIKIIPVQEVSTFGDGETVDVPGRPRAVHAPGHTPGHAAVLLEGRRILLTGDALATRNPLTGRVGPQIMPSGLNRDTPQALRSLDALSGVPADLLLPGHGEPWTQGTAEAGPSGQGCRPLVAGRVHVDPSAPEPHPAGGLPFRQYRVVEESPNLSGRGGGPTVPDRPLLVAGAPRTGTTWVATVLSLAQGVTWINEPDNEWPNLFALKAKRGLGRFPVLEAGDAAPRAYEQLWDRALGGYRAGRYREALAWKLDQGERTMADLWRAMCDHHPRLSPRLRLLTLLATPPSIRTEARPVLVKSVHAPLALEWIAESFRPRLVVVLRHPLNVIASWTELGWGGCALETSSTVRERFGAKWGLPELPADSSRLHRVAWEVGLFTCALQEAADRHPDRLVAPHETLCQDPEAGFRRLYERLGLEWQERASSYLEESNRPGTGWSTSRVVAEQPESWRRRLSAEQVRDIWSVLSRFQAPWVEHLARDVE